MTRWHRARGWLLFGLAALLALAVATWTTRNAESWPDPLDPRNPGPEGAQALARVLTDSGVELEIARSAQELDAAQVDETTTVVVTSAQHLSPSTFARLRSHAAPGGLVIIDPRTTVTESLEVEARSGGPDEVRAECAGALAGLRLVVDQLTSFRTDAAAACFATTEGDVLVRLDDGGDGDTTLFGAGQALSNDQVLRGDNAAVALRLLGEREHLLWYVPDAADATAEEAVSVSSLLPRWLGPGLWLGGLALIALIGWRFRRLGPLSTEPLPVVVRAVETARSRGRLYRRSGDRGHAATALRAAARADLAGRLRLGERADPAAVAEATARHLGARVEDIDHLLNDRQAAPANDRELIRLAESLTRLRREIRRG